MKKFLFLISSLLVLRSHFQPYFYVTATSENENILSDSSTSQQNRNNQQNSFSELKNDHKNAVTNDDKKRIECLQYGYNPETLLCSICLKIKNILNDDMFVQECYQCCNQQLSDSEFMKYQLIILEIDKKFLKQNEELYQYTSKKNRYIASKTLVIRHKYHMLPTLLMYNERNDLEPSRVMNIASWSLDEIKEFLKVHLSEAGDDGESSDEGGEE